VWLDAAVAADRLGFESAWLPVHLVIPFELEGELAPGGGHPPVPPTTPVYDPIGYLSYVAARTERLRLGTYVYLLGLRHPFVPARGFATLDVLSGGRALLGAGSGWLTTEWEAMGIDPAVRVERLCEAIGVCRRLWTEEAVEHHGAHFDFGPVGFEPRPVQRPIPVHLGGESPGALRRAAALGDGWLGMSHTPESAAERVGSLRQLLEDRDRDPVGFEFTVMGRCNGPDELDEWEDAGVDRLIVSLGHRSAEVVDNLERIAAYQPRAGS
jgi:probable F420-dependent oxidoreductase